MAIASIKTDKVMSALLKELGSHAAIGRRIGRSRQTIRFWHYEAKDIPDASFAKMEKLLEKVLDSKNINCTKSPLINTSTSKDTTVDALLTLSDRIKLAMRYEALIGSRRGYRSDLKKKEPEIKSGLFNDCLPDSNLIDTNLAELPLAIQLKNIKGRLDDFLAKELQFGSRTRYHQAKKVVMKGIPELIKTMDEKRLSLHVCAAIAELTPSAQLAELTKDRSKIKNHSAIHKESGKKLSLSIQAIQTQIYSNPQLLEAEKQYHLPLCTALTGLVCSCNLYAEFKWQADELKDHIFPYVSINFTEVLNALVDCGAIQKTACHGEVCGRISLSSIHFTKKA